jgi:hypothetical protein
MAVRKLTAQEYTAVPEELSRLIVTDESGIDVPIGKHVYRLMPMLHRQVVQMYQLLGQELFGLFVNKVGEAMPEWVDFEKIMRDQDLYGHFVQIVLEGLEPEELNELTAQQGMYLISVVYAQNFDSSVLPPKATENFGKVRSSILDMIGRMTDVAILTKLSQASAQIVESLSTASQGTTQDGVPDGKGGVPPLSARGGQTEPATTTGSDSPASPMSGSDGSSTTGTRPGGEK